MAGILKSERRIVMAALYLGTDRLERELVDCFESRLKDCGVDCPLHVHVLLDCIRGSRGTDNSRLMLVPLVKSHMERMRVSLYHTPVLNQLFKYIIPEKFNETVGLQHIKIFLFDDDLLVSGANLSESYFTNRQDRYILIRECPELGDFCEQLVNAVAAHSYSLQPDNSLKAGEIDPLSMWTRTQFAESFRLSVQKLIKPKPITDIKADKRLNTDTWIYPFVQMGSYNVRQDQRMMSELLRHSLPGCRTLLASGYFNLTDDYVNLIMRSQGHYRILAASPEANGFLGANGAAGHIPYAYLHIARWFHNRLVCEQQTSRVLLEEYTRDGWTFHGKGMWYYLPYDELPVLTMVGSSNYGYRSVERDLELQFAIITNNPLLQQELKKEHEHLFDQASIVTADTFKRPDRQIHWLQSLVTRMIWTYL
ncbi:CDP-diacylglycerol--glycerol-3-phosphate 3-phosphatidyltransferase, mitochondrial-like isoform X2 [Corticium candelabrum]|uniref:CDP-diacylglycerol--glycerol-3-phosphate 3-phosphatidyltransferase, mitochondrial-like isoform X2 n=1 Tax=Corticium candelabrum TaxID=121492 RepID=UPI002E36409C|nr:CDP-diacylglycerol--glycerol-3-phosphate 3-phosphatidyltransferase, mitochondrial-like isoform X2 [Corticium candelabrum]